MVVAIVAIVAVGFGVRAMSVPAERAGTPTIAVPSPTGTRFTTPSPTPSPSGTESGSTSPSASGSKSASPTGSVKASNAFDWATLNVAAAGSEGALTTIAVAVEDSAKLTPNTVAKTVSGVLNDPRSWTGDGEVRFSLVPQAKADVKLYLASTATAADLCGSSSAAAYTCVKGDTVVINANQWKAAASSYAGDTTGYRTFLINHAVGQLIGKKNAKCGGKGEPAPVMLQQGAGLGGCTANPWP